MASDLDKHYAAYRKAQAAGDAGAAEVIKGRILAAQKAQQGQGALEGMNTAEKFLAGAGQGMVNTAKNVGDIVGRVPGLGFLRPDAEKWAEERELSKPLLDTGAGATGSFVGETVATLPVGGVAAAGGKAAAAKIGTKLLSKAATPMGQAMLSGAASGAVLSGPENRQSGAFVGAALPYGLGKAGGLMRKGYQGLVKTTPAAKKLSQEGVDLTIGQMAPESLIGQMEELATDLPVLRQAIGARRGAARGQWQGLVLDEARAPGAAKLNPAAAVDDRLSAAYESFDAAYAPIKAKMVFPAVHNGGNGIPLQSTKKTQGAFARAVSDPEVLATPQTRRMVGGWLENQLGILPGGTQRPGLIKRVPAEQLLKIRENIRGKIREKLSGANPDHEAAQLLGNAERAVTDALETQLPAESSAALKAVDAAYRKHKIVSDSVRRAGDSPAGFTPAQLSASVKASTPEAAYARGEGGRLRELAQTGREVFESSIPKTGVRAIPLMASAPVTIPMAMLASTKRGTKLLTGSTRGQQKLQQLEDQIRRRILQAGGPEALEEGAAGAGALVNTSFRGGE